MSSAPRKESAARAVPKALRMLYTVVERKRPLAIAEIAAALDLPQPTARRIVTVLGKPGFVYCEPGGRRVLPPLPARFVGGLPNRFYSSNGVNS